jgi:hypothetical protein
MSAPVTASIPHRLGKEEATRRIKAGFGRMRGNLSTLVAIDQEEWKGDTLQFNVRGFGSTALGTVTVFDDSLRIEVVLPWLLAKVASRLLPTLQKEATLLLEKR